MAVLYVHTALVKLDREKPVHILLLYILFAIEAQTQATKNTSCTLKPCAWLPPTMKNIGFAEIADIEFTKPSTKRKQLMTGGYVDTDDKSISKSARSDLSKVPVPEPTETELNSFYKDLFDHGRPAILSIIPEYSDA